MSDVALRVHGVYRVEVNPEILISDNHTTRLTELVFYDEDGNVKLRVSAFGRETPPPIHTNKLTESFVR